MENLGYKLERKLVEMLDAERNAQGIDVYELGRLAFEDRKEGRKVFSHIIHGYTSRGVKGKLRGLSVEDFYRFCKALNIDPLRIFSAAMISLQGFGAEKDGEKTTKSNARKHENPGSVAV